MILRGEKSLNESTPIQSEAITAMKLKALLFLLLAALLPLAAPRTAQAADVSFDYFYDALLPYGEWVEVTGYGLCWRPTEVDADWVPYSDGYWAFTDAGWTWVGYEEFAGIVYHYGRWINVVDVGWVWQPDYEWGPAWVSWRNSDDYIGWAPLPPRAYWQPEIGISTWVDTVCDIGPGFYNFCRVRDFGAPVLRLVIVNHTRNVTIIRNTVNITNITYNSWGEVPVIYNGGPSYAVISSRCERPIPALKLVRTTHFDRTDFHGGPGRWSPNARTVGNQLIVNAPIVAPPVQPAFLKEKVKRVFAADRVTTGWAGVKDGKVRDDLRQHFQRETKGLTPYTAPARAVVATDLQVVPAQADAHAVPPVFTGKGPRGKGDGRPPVIMGSPLVPVQPASAVSDAAKPMKDGGATVSPGVPQPVDPRGVVRSERENGRGKNGEANNPPVVTGGPLKPFNQDAVTNPVVTAPAQDKVADPRAGGKNDRPKMDREAVQNPVVIAPPDAEKSAVQPREDRGPKPMKDAPAGGFHAPGTDPAPPAQAAAEAAKAAREQANIQQQKTDVEKLRALQADADKLKAEQERMARQREADANAAALREKQTTAREQANTQQQKMDTEKLRAAQAEMEKTKGEQERLTRQREAEANAAAMRQKQAAEAAVANAGKEKMQAQQQQRAQDAAKQQAAERAREQQMEQQHAAQEAAKQQALEQRRQQQMEAQRAAQDAARQQAAELAREVQMEQQRAAQEAAKQQALEQRRQQQMEQQRTAQDAARQQAAEQQRQQQMEQQRAAQENARQQAEQQHRAMEAQREQAGRQQMEAQRAAQQQAAQAAQAAQQAAQDARRGEKEKEKDKDKNR